MLSLSSFWRYSYKSLSSGSLLMLVSTGLYPGGVLRGNIVGLIYNLSLAPSLSLPLLAWLTLHVLHARVHWKSYVKTTSAQHAQKACMNALLFIAMPCAIH